MFYPTFFLPQKESSKEKVGAIQSSDMMALLISGLRNNCTAKLRIPIAIGTKYNKGKLLPCF
jgi:hypothetical protein